MAKKDQVNWNSFTKAELIKTIRTLHVRQTKLLNRIAELEQLDKQTAVYNRDVACYPWENTLSGTVTYEPSSGKPQCRKEGE